jgi:hypothetical protein
MDGPTIQARVYAGYAKAANVIGLPYQQYRPLAANAPLGNLVATIKAAFDSSPNYKFTTPNEYGDPTWFALINDASVQTGDYLIGNGDVKFVAGKQFLLPVIVIDCNRTLKITRQQAQTTVGAVGYGGNVPSQEVDVLGAPGAFWPASILFGGKSQAGVGLPAGVKNIGWRILLPPSVPITIKAGDIATDDLGRRYAIDGAELTDLGWRINAQEVHS